MKNWDFNKIIGGSKVRFFTVMLVWRREQGTSFSSLDQHGVVGLA